MGTFHKGRIRIYILLTFFIGLLIDSNQALFAQNLSQQDSSKYMGIQPDDSSLFYFESKEQALDTLIAWLLLKKPTMSTGYLGKATFVAQWRSHDTATLKQVVEGAWLTYQFKFKKSLLKTQLKMKQSKVNFKMVEVVPRPKITVSVAGDGITKYDYTVKYKKLKYVLSFQLWWIDGKGYWVNEVAWSMGV
jgi:hypothetical protein